MNEDAYKKTANSEVERNILRVLFKAVIAAKPVDIAISDSKIVRDTKAKLKTALRDATHKCTCIRRSWGGLCEVCQASDGELVTLRNFYNVIRTAKNCGMTAEEIQEFVENAEQDFK